VQHRGLKQISLEPSMLHLHPLRRSIMPSIRQEIIYNIYGSPVPVWIVKDAKGREEEFLNHSDAYGRFLALYDGAK